MKTKSILSARWPKRRITRFVIKSKSKGTRFAYLECKHRRSVDGTPRKSVRCRACGLGKKAVKKTAAKPVKKAA